MKSINIDEVKKLLVIIKDAPSIRVGHFSDSFIELSALLEEFCNSRDYEYILYAINKEFEESAKDIVKNVKLFNLKRAKYMQNGKFFDYLFVSADIKDIESFVKKAHSVIKNAGEIIILVEKNNYKIIDLWRNYLEENYYVATNIIEIDANYSVIISKKMHGWGG